MIEEKIKQAANNFWKMIKEVENKNRFWVNQDEDRNATGKPSLRATIGREEPLNLRDSHEYPFLYYYHDD